MANRGKFDLIRNDLIICYLKVVVVVFSITVTDLTEENELKVDLEYSITKVVKPFYGRLRVTFPSDISLSDTLPYNFPV